MAITQGRSLKLAAALKLESKANSYARENKIIEAEAALRESLAIRRQYLEGEPPTAEALELVVSCMLQRNKLGEAVQLLDEIVTPAVVARPECSELLTMRAELRARNGQWEAAAADASLLVKKEPDNHYRYHMLAPLLAATTNLSAYQNLCSNILVYFSNTTDLAVADRMAKDCLILPSAGVDLNVVAKMAILTVTKGKGHGAYSLFQCCAALAQYRLGNYNEAITWAEGAAKNSFTYSQAEAYAVLSMAQYKLGNEDYARQALSDCNLVVERRLPSPGQQLDQDWRDWIIAHALRKEAEELLNHEAP